MGENNKIRARVQHKHKTEAEWRLDVYDEQGKLRKDPFIPLNGELVIFDEYENYDYKRFKFGDGITNVMDLPFDVDVDATLNSAKAYTDEKTRMFSYEGGISGGHFIHINKEKEARTYIDIYGNRLRFNDKPVAITNDIDEAKVALIGTGADTADSATIVGAKKYADVAAEEAKAYTDEKTRMISEEVGAQDEKIEDLEHITQYMSVKTSDDKTTFTTPNTTVDINRSSFDVSTRNITFSTDGTFTLNEKAVAIIDDVDKAKSVVIGTDADTADSDTIYGAKKHADAMSETAKTYTNVQLKNYIPIEQKGVANGVATLNENGKIPQNQLPSYTDVLEFDNIRALQECINMLEEIIYNGNGSPGLAYEISDDGTYAVCTGIGKAKSLLISIAPTYQNLPVIAIDEEAFAGNTNITSLILPEGLTTIGNAAFKGCTNLSTIRLPNTLAFMGDYAFYGCSSLKTLELTGSTLGQYAFAYCYGLTDITRNKNCQITTIPQYAFYNCTNLINVDFTGLTTIEQYAFAFCSFENGLTIPANIETVGGNAFRNIKATVVIANCLTLGVSAFNNSPSLIVAYLNCKTIFNSVIDQCSKCTTVYLTKPYDDLSINQGAFNNADSLTDIYVTWGEGDVANYPWDTTNPKFTVHYNCDTVIEGVKYTKHDTYYSCDGLVDTSKTSITIVDQIGATPVENITGFAFENCPITEIILGSNIKSIEGVAFANCNNLETVHLNENLESIGYEAFKNCNALTYITIPSNVVSIGDMTFVGASLEKAKFINPYNWTVTSSWDENDIQQLSYQALEQDNTAAEYLKITYSDYRWTRN